MCNQTPQSHLNNPRPLLGNFNFKLWPCLMCICLSPQFVNISNQQPTSTNINYTYRHLTAISGKKQQQQQQQQQKKKKMAPTNQPTPTPAGFTHHFAAPFRFLRRHVMSEECGGSKEGSGDSKVSRKWVDPLKKKTSKKHGDIYIYMWWYIYI